MSAEDQNKSVLLFKLAKPGCGDLFAKMENNLRVTCNTKQELIASCDIYFSSSHSFSSL